MSSMLSPDATAGTDTAGQLGLSETFDLLVIGSGIACTHTLSSVLSFLPTNTREFRIAILEQNGQFWRGLPYGRHSSPNSLIITNVAEFVPEEERADFIAWLMRHKRDWTARLRRLGGEAARQWLRDNARSMEDGKWDEIYIPRQLYGDFAEENILRTIGEAKRAGVADVTMWTGQATDMEPLGSGYAIEFDQHGDRKRLKAQTVLVAIGSPPFKALPGSKLLGGRGPLYVNNAYFPALPDNLAALERKLKTSPEPDVRNVLIVGSNATSLELVFMLGRDQGLINSLHKIVVLSPSGKFPHRMTGERIRTSKLSRLEALSRSASITPAAVIEAAEADLEELARSAEPIGALFEQISEVMVGVLEKLDAGAQREFHHRYGMRFTRLVRRAGPEYRDCADTLCSEGKLHMVSGEFLNMGLGETNGAHVTYRDASGKIGELPQDFAAVFNCSGFEEVSENSSSRFLANLVRRGLARPNPTGRGIDIGEGFMASPGLFVCGPLLAGVFNENARFWHVENVRRIHGLSRLIGRAIAECLVSKLCPAGSEQGGQ